MTGGSRFSLASDFTDELVGAVKDLAVDELYGKIEDDGFGGGRPRFLVPKIGWRRLSRHVERARQEGIGFNYLLNSAAEGTGEAATPAGHRRLRSLLARLEEIGVSSVTVVSPFFLRVIKKFTTLKARVSVFARVDDERKVRTWFEEGADRIVLDSMLVNRDPDRLERVARAAVGRGELELLVNNRCELGCAWAPCHAVDLGASSVRKAPVPDACFFQCHADFTRQPARFLVQDWIRPEDLHLYERLGYSHFKIAGRGCTTSELVTRTRAYASRRYEGNLVDLLRRGSVHIDAAAGIATVFTGGWRRILGLGRAAKTAQAFEDQVIIDNRSLDGYLDLVFKKGGCIPGKCWRCDLCEHWAARAVKVPAEVVRRAEATDEALVAGEL